MEIRHKCDIMNWYKKAQEIYRGDPNPMNLDDYDPAYGTETMGKPDYTAASWGPGIYFTDQEDVARMYGSNITKKNIHNAKILTPQSPLFNYQQIDKILKDIDKEKIETAISNYDEDYNTGKKMLIQSIINANNPLEQLMGIWADVFYHQNPSKFIELMIKNRIDGISLQKKDVTYYVIYNRNILI